MANQEHVAVLRQGVETWNAWRREHVGLKPELRAVELATVDLTAVDLSEANLRGADLREADLRGANLSGASLRGVWLSGAALSRADLQRADLHAAVMPDVGLTRANLTGARLGYANLRNATLVEAVLIDAHLDGANLRGAILGDARLDRSYLRRADLKDAYLRRAFLTDANLTNASLKDADLREADLSRSTLSGADLRGVDLRDATMIGATITSANLSYARLIHTAFDERSDLTGCTVYGISAWGLALNGARQANLVITKPNEPTITVDSLEVAQFIYLLLRNQTIRDVINTITSKAVLILGRFTPDRRRVLEAIREELRRLNYLPILFDFDKPTARSLSETVSTLAHLARFIIADITEARSVIQELTLLAPTLRSVPIQPIMHAQYREWAMLVDHLDLPHVLTPYVYESEEELCAALPEWVIAPVEQRASEIEVRRAKLDVEAARRTSRLTTPPNSP